MQKYIIKLGSGRIMKEEFKKVKRIIKYFNKTIGYVHKKTMYPYTFLFFDILWCFIRYGTTYNDYRIFEFYNINSSLRKTYVSKRKYNMINKKLVDTSIVNVINDKSLFLLRFKDYIGKELICLKDLSFKSFENYALENPRIIARSNSSSYISSYKRYDLSDFRSPAFLNGSIKDDKLSIVEGNFVLNKELSQISDLVVVNILTVYNSGADIVASTIKYRDNNKIINGFIDIDSGCIKGSFKDPDGHNYGPYFDGLEVPEYNKMKELARELCHELEEIRQVEWSFIVNNRGKVYLADANVWTDYVFAQTPEFLKNKIGLMSYYNKVL